VARSLLRTVVVGILLVALHQGYLRAYVWLEQALRPNRSGLTIETLRPSASKQEAMRLARLAFGEDHWTTPADLPWRYYNSARGYWLYAREQALSADRKTVTFSPFALIWRSEGGGTEGDPLDDPNFNLITVLAERAEVVLDQPLNAKNTGRAGGLGNRIVTARIDGDVLARDHRKTIGDPRDDLIVKMPYLEYVERDFLIRSDAPVILWDQDFQISGVNLTIELIPSVSEETGVPSGTAGGTAGFAGVNLIRLDRDVHIYARETGGDSFLPGRPRPRVRVGGAERRPVQGQEQERERGGEGQSTTGGLALEVALAAESERDVLPELPLAVDSAAAKGRPGEPIPVELRCDGAMRIVPPFVVQPNRDPKRDGPAPTMAYFTRNVKVSRGFENAVDQLNCDDLTITLVPEPRLAIDPTASAATHAVLQGAALGIGQFGVGVSLAWSAHAGILATCSTAATTALAKASPARSDSAPASRSKANSPLDSRMTASFERLTPRRVLAEGHAVWLQSQGLGLKARGTKLTYDRPGSGRPDRAVLDAGPTSRVFVEQVDLDPRDPAKIRSVATVRSRQVTILDDGSPGGPINLRAQGPGTLEEREEAGQPARRTVSWDELLELRSPAQDQRILILTGRPALYDARSGTLQARDRIVAWLKAQPRPVNAEAPVAAATRHPRDSGSFRIERLQAFNQVKLDAPGQSLMARDRLDAFFETPEAVHQVQTTTARLTGPPVDTAVGPVAARWVVQEANALANPAAGAGTQGAGRGEAAPAAAPSTWKVEAQMVWARLTARSNPTRSAALGDNAGEAAAFTPLTPTGNGVVGGDGAWDLEQAFLRGGVAVRQEFPADSPQAGTGLRVEGVAVDVERKAEDRHLLKIVGDEARPVARVWNSQFDLRGPKMVVNQLKEFAYVEGAGELTTWGEGPLGGSVKAAGPVATARRAALQDDEGTPAAAASSSQARPKTIRWTRLMTFEGRVVESDGVERPARARFDGGVRGDLGDADIACERLTAYLDQAVSFAGVASLLEPPGANREPRLHPRAVGEADARPEANATPPPLQVAWVRAEGGVALTHRPINARIGRVDQIVRASGPVIVFDRGSGAYQIEGAGMVRHHQWKIERRQPTTRVEPQPDGSARTVTVAAAERSFWQATRVTFQKGMMGRVGLDSSSVGFNTRGDQPQRAEFLGDVDLIQARVETADEDLNPDAPPPDFVRLSAARMIVDTLPPPPDAPADVKQWLLMEAIGSANARTRDTSIQGATIKYDSLRSTCLVQGARGRDVLVVRQDQPGAGVSYGQSGSVLVNLKTRDVALVDPKSGDLLTRPGAPLVAPPPVTPRPDRLRDRFPRPSQRNDRERSDVGAGQRVLNGAGGNNGFLP